MRITKWSLQHTFKLNDFTWAFQEITNTYGVPTYKELNPSVFGIVTFPFLFGVMYGDLGHGGILFILGIFLWLFAENLKGTALKTMLPARYIILMMGFFATFAGLCYNDFMSIPVEGESCYTVKIDHDKYQGKKDADWVYSIGVDPIWYLAINNLTYINNLKMKMAVIFGVAQMSLGIFCKALNSIHFGKLLDFLFEFIPQIVMLLWLFGFMDFLIITKWLEDWETKQTVHESPGIIAVRRLPLHLTDL